ncbi:MAG: LysE family translocator [Verrucomicrobia bacterium]|jgi:threonine/homoserine/homoserine lactone efflux protein|nr:LysE family translocator [Verrucomicrobiota bacterium]
MVFSEPFVACLLGVASGFLVSIPVGPINITIINEGARRGFRSAALISLGAMTMDFLYCALAFAGFSGVFSSPILRASIELLSFLAMLYLGIKYLRVTDLPITSKSLERVEHRLHPHSAFMIGFVRVLGNPGALLFWIALSATFISHRWIDTTWISKASCVVGMTIGALAWFLVLSYAVSLGHGKISAKTLARMSHISGASLLIVAFCIGSRLVFLLAQRGR